MVVVLAVVVLVVSLCVLDLAVDVGCEADEAAGLVEFTLELNGRRIFRFRILSLFDGL